jgi:hypothetical protein
MAVGDCGGLEAAAEGGMTIQENAMPRLVQDA